MKKTTISDEQVAAIRSLLCEFTGLPPGQVAGFTVIVAVYEEDGSPGARLIGSTNLRTIATMIDVVRGQITEDLDRLSELS